MLLGAIIVIYTYNTFRLTTLVYVLLCLGSIIALIGEHYGYGKVPLFNGFKDHFQLGRNYYDQFAHLLGGLVAAMTLREILLRTLQLNNTKFLISLVLGLTLVISASYELAEGLVALVMGGSAEAFLNL